MTHIGGCSCDGPARAQADGLTARDVWDGPACAGPCSALPCGTLSLSRARVRAPLARLALAPPGPHARGASPARTGPERAGPADPAGPVGLERGNMARDHVVGLWHRRRLSRQQHLRQRLA